MRPFARGVATAALLALALVGAASLAGVEVALDVDGLPETDTANDTAVTATGGASPTATESPGTLTRADVRTEFYARLNEFREKQGRAAVSHSPALHEAARSHSRDMAAQGYFAHQAPDGSVVDDRIREAGSRCTSAGENIILTEWRTTLAAEAGPEYLDSDADVAHRLAAQWRASEGHREIMLLRAATDVGLGVAVTDDGTIYATLVIC